MKADEEQRQKRLKLPWKLFSNIEEYNFIIDDADGNRIAKVESIEDAKRFLHLPEMLQTIIDAVIEINKITAAWEEGVDFADYCDSCLIDNVPLPHENTCKWMQLYCNVEDGK